jgi:hypothetical protein
MGEHSPLFGYFKNCWFNKTISKEQLQNAVDIKKYIIQSEFDEIISSPTKDSI